MTRVLVVGGGLAGSLLALRLRAVRRDVDVSILERGPAVGGHHTWSFHLADLDAEEERLVAPLVERRWDGYEVRFPRYRRPIGLGYASIRSSRLHDAVVAAWPRGVSVNADVRAIEAAGARLADGRWIAADCVVDARGFADTPPAGRWGYQSFLGRDLVLAAPHGLARPLLMDATVRQEGGFRFVYALPWDERTVLVEDTCYGSASLDRDAARARIAEWAQARGWSVESVRREEEGVLPIPLAVGLDDLYARGAAAPIGVRAGLFHATTGYSLPGAARLAVGLAGLPLLDTAAVAGHVRRHAEREWARQGFFRLLNRLLFDAAREPARYRILERFYRLPEPLIARFYAGRPTWADRARLLVGRPPVPVLRALQAALPFRTAEARA